MYSYSNNKDSYREPELSLTKFTESQVNLINKFRMLWEQHDIWTRSTIMSVAFNLPDLDFFIKRLLRNPIDFGHVLKVFYGYRIASAFTKLLNAHLVIAAQLVEAAKEGNKEAAAAAERQWYENADEIAVLLGSINPF